MARGRPPNVLHDAARQAGEKFYAEQFECDFCGTNKHYVSNGACVQCAINRGNARYAALGEQDKEAQRRRDHDRYLRRLAKAANAQT